LSVLARSSSQFVAIDGRTPERVIRHVPVWITEIDPIGIECRTERTAGIARSGRHEHTLEPRLGQDPCIGAAVQRDAAAEAQIRHAGLLAKRARQVHQRVLEYSLDARSTLREALALSSLEVDRLVRIARRTEQLDEPRGIRSRRRRVVLEIFRNEREFALRGASNHPPNFLLHRRTTLYSSSFTANPRYAVNVEYSMPSECGYLISRRSVMSVLPPGWRSP